MIFSMFVIWSWGPCRFKVFDDDNQFIVTFVFCHGKYVLMLEAGLPFAFPQLCFVSMCLSTSTQVLQSPGVLLNFQSISVVLYLLYLSFLLDILSANQHTKYRPVLTVQQYHVPEHRLHDVGLGLRLNLKMASCQFEVGGTMLMATKLVFPEFVGQEK